MTRGMCDYCTRPFQDWDDVFTVTSFKASTVVGGAVRLVDMGESEFCDSRCFYNALMECLESEW